MTETVIIFPAFSSRFVEEGGGARRSDVRVKFDSGVIFLDQSQFFATHSNQSDGFILYRQQITSNGFFRVY